MNVINLGYFQGGSAGHCGYCESQQSHTIGLVAAQLSPNIYKQMMDRGWRRCGTYYYKYQFQKCCCLPYTIREDVLLNEQKKSQRKIGKRFMQLLQNNGWQSQNFNIKEIIKDFEKNYQLQQQIKPIKQQNIIIQQQQKEQIGVIKQQQELNLEIKVQLLTIFDNFTAFLKENIRQFIELFKAYFELKGFDIVNVRDIFQVEVDCKTIKIFNSNDNKKNKGDYYSNYIMMIYGLNKKNLFQDLSIDKFAMTTKYFIENHFLNEKYQFILENNGFLSIFEKNHIDLAIKHQLKIEQKILKNQVKVVQKVELQQQKQQAIGIQIQLLLDPIQLIDIPSFKTNLFKVGNMKIVLKKAECTDENFKLYQTYCKVIHKKEKESKEGYAGFLCEQGLKADLQKSNIDPQQLLFLGCYHMCYYLQDKLVAVGVVDITQQALSSVYFFYDPEFEDFNFGTFGALVEIEYIQLLSKYFPEFKYYYLGFYLQTTPKMLYKGDFEPAELLCPESYTWVALNKEIRQIIEQSSKQQANVRKVRLSDPKIQCIADMKGGDMILYKEIQIEMKGQVMKLGNLNQKFVESIRKYLDCATESLGRTLMGQLKFQL